MDSSSKSRSRVIRLLGNLTKLLGYGFHAVLPNKRYSLPTLDSSLESQNNSSLIPKKIWQTNFSEKCTLPMYLNYKFNRSLSRDFEYHYVSTEDRDEYMKNHASERVYAAFKRLTDGAAQADLWRLVVLYNEGGIYMDIDATLVNPLSKTVEGNQHIFIKNYGEFTNFFLATVPKSELFAEFIEKVVANIENYSPADNKNVFDTTGPGALWEVMKSKDLAYQPHQGICIQGAFTNEHFQYMDRPRSKWIYKKTFIQ